MPTITWEKTTFLKSAAKLHQLPPDEGAEIAFAGRSNAGKSSALNVLVGMRALARVSKTPGRTRLLNVFQLGETTQRLVDLPGYGYAKVSQSTQAEWQVVLGDYLKVRRSLCGLVLLMDIRHPLKPSDELCLNFPLSRGLPVHVLLTKSDKLSKSQAQSTLLRLKKQFSAFPQITWQLFSALTKQGRDTLIMQIEAWLTGR